MGIEEVLVENTLDGPVAAVLDRPLFCFLATRAADGSHDPRVSPLWYEYDADADADADVDDTDGGDGPGAFRIVADARKSYLDRARRHPSVALAVVDFRPATGRVRHVGVRGEAAVEPFDPERADRLFARYAGPREARDERFRADEMDPGRWRFLRVTPTSAVARDQSYAPPGDGGG